MEKQKLSFFKKVKTSVLDFDGYQNLAAEKVTRTIGYIALIILIFSVVIAATYVYESYNAINKAKEYINNEISEIKYENYELDVIPASGEKTIEIIPENAGQPIVVINTAAETEEEINESINNIKSQKNGILILKDKIIIQSEAYPGTLEKTYKEISEQYNINKIDKQELINILSGREMAIALCVLALAMVLYLFILYVSNILIDIFFLSILAYIVSRISGLRLKYSAIYNIATYSLTLPLILNIIYFAVNSLTGFTIEYFRVMYTAIASVYIITAILMIKSDVIRKQYELNKIIEEQERVKEELKRQEEEKKEKEEQERREREREKEREKKKKQEQKDKGEIGKEPEGDNA